MLSQIMCYHKSIIIVITNQQFAIAQRNLKTSQNCKNIFKNNNPELILSNITLKMVALSNFIKGHRGHKPPASGFLTIVL